MSSPARRHREETLARLAIQQAAGSDGVAQDRNGTGPEASAYELLLAALGADMARLRDIRSVESKVELKRELIGAYDAHVAGTLAAAAEEGKALQDEIVATMMVWRLDIGDYATALDIGEHVLRFGLRLSGGITRSPSTLLAEEIAEAALASDRTGAIFPLDILDRTDQLTAGYDMHDQVRAKLWKARGRILTRIGKAMEDKPETAAAGGPRAARASALAAFERAQQLDRNAGVKKDIEQLTRAVKADQESTAGAPAPGGGEGTGE